MPQWECAMARNPRIRGRSGSTRHKKKIHIMELKAFRSVGVTLRHEKSQIWGKEGRAQRTQKDPRTYNEKEDTGNNRMCKAAGSIEKKGGPLRVKRRMKRGRRGDNNGKIPNKTTRRSTTHQELLIGRSRNLKST